MTIDSCETRSATQFTHPCTTLCSLESSLDAILYVPCLRFAQGVRTVPHPTVPKLHVLLFMHCDAHLVQCTCAHIRWLQLIPMPEHPLGPLSKLVGLWSPADPCWGHTNEPHLPHSPLYRKQQFRTPWSTSVSALGSCQSSHPSPS